MTSVEYFMRMVMVTCYRLSQWLVSTWYVIRDNAGLWAWLIVFAYGLMELIRYVMAQ